MGKYSNIYAQTMLNEVNSAIASISSNSNKIATISDNISAYMLSSAKKNIQDALSDVRFSYQLNGSNASLLKALNNLKTVASKIMDYKSKESNLNALLSGPKDDKIQSKIDNQRSQMNSLEKEIDNLLQ